MRRARGMLPAVLLGSLVAAMPAAAFESAQALQKGTWVLSLEAGGGSQSNFEAHANQTDLDLWYAGLRVGHVPLEPRGRGALRGALEIGLEPVYQRYPGPVSAFFAGLALLGRYHFLGLGRLVPYLELAAAAGGTDLDVIEIDSHFTFWLAAGAGVSVFVSEGMALYAGYRLIHMSNGNTDDPNRGFEAHTGLAGVSFYLR